MARCQQLWNWILWCKLRMIIKLYNKKSYEKVIKLLIKEDNWKVKLVNGAWFICTLDNSGEMKKFCIFYRKYSKGKKWFYICVVVPNKLPVYTRKGSEFQQETPRMARIKIYATRSTTSIKTNNRRRHFVFLKVIKIYPSTLLS